VALIALVRMLDPGRRSQDGGLAEADADLLIRTLLFEERQLDEASSSAGNHDPDAAADPASIRHFS
jgi:hypothetical protein